MNWVLALAFGIGLVILGMLGFFVPYDDYDDENMDWGP